MFRYTGGITNDVYNRDNRKVEKNAYINTHNEIHNVYYI